MTLLPQRLFSPLLKYVKYRVKCAKTAENAEQGCNPGRIPQQPCVQSLREKHERDENRAPWRMECRLGIITGHVQR